LVAPVPAEPRELRDPRDPRELRELREGIDCHTLEAACVAACIFY
jgi:hypothetical protein